MNSRFGTANPARYGLRPRTAPGPRIAPSFWTLGPLAVVALLVACGEVPPTPSGEAGEETSAGSASLDRPDVARALALIRADAVETHMGVLAHDSLAGRAPGTDGYEGASRYVESRLSELGLEPAGDDGFRQPVPLRESLVDEDASGLSFELDGRVVELAYAEDFTLSPDPLQAEAEVTAPVVFAGYAVSAPRFGYDDLAGIDVEGKIVAHLTGAPPSLPSNPRAYYSSGATKRTELAARGAVGIITFTSPDDPRFRWNVSVARSRRGGFTWLDETGVPREGSESPLRGSASLNHPAVETLFEDSPVPLAQVFAAAATSTPQGFNLPVTATIRTTSRHRPVQSHNVVARLEGGDPGLRDEHVVYVAHIDHFGIGTPVEGDSIYNGAHDNASGVSIVLEVARAFSSLQEPPRRSILFLFVTAEEWGLLGSDYFVTHPTVPAPGLVAVMSLDMPFLFHPLLDIVPYGAEHSTLSDAVGAAAEHLGLALGPDPIPEQVLFIRSDHYSFVKRGIPALFIKSGFETGDPTLDGAAINAGFRRDRYHTPFDDLSQAFDYEAGAQHARVNFLTGFGVAMQDARPRWNDGDFFGGLFGRP